MGPLTVTAFSMGITTAAIFIGIMSIFEFGIFGETKKFKAEAIKFGYAQFIVKGENETEFEWLPKNVEAEELDEIGLIKRATNLGMALDKDNYGQYVIYTHLKENEHGQYEEMTAEDFNDEEALYKA